MKTRTIANFLAPFFALILSNAFAQDAQDTLKASTDSVPVFYATAKVAIYTGNLHDLEGMSTLKLKVATDVSPKVTDAFHTSFKGAENDKWFFHDKKGKEYLVKFDYNKRDYKVLLDKKGKVFYTMFDGLERDLSTAMRKSIRAWYPDYAVVGLVKVKTDDKNAAIVNMRNGSDLMVISVENEAISEVGPYKMEQYDRGGKKKEIKNALAAAPVIKK